MKIKTDVAEEVSSMSTNINMAPVHTPQHRVPLLLRAHTMPPHTNNKVQTTTNAPRSEQPSRVAPHRFRTISSQASLSETPTSLVRHPSNQTNNVSLGDTTIGNYVLSNTELVEESR